MNPSTERYQTPVIITENGLSNIDWVMQNDKVHDLQRIDFMSRYLQEYRRAIAAGVDARGYLRVVADGQLRRPGATSTASGSCTSTSKRSSAR